MKIQKKMSTGRTCNSSFWTKEEDKINENALAIYSEDKDLCTNMEETLPGKSRDDIINHYNILIEDVEPIDSGRVPLPNYPEVQSYSNENSRGRMAKRGFLDKIETQCTQKTIKMLMASYLLALGFIGRSVWVRG
ncbi:hypothetical protein T459_22692 [Capsicum annuum]|uniref:Myb-like domain-containing protein n=1 Tax=Capsicum annuum TaxID=4072 RepID=A0A2G2YQ80_CAPAN|nr:hypothetical protein T459_22692 [Capsicum annuum]